MVDILRIPTTFTGLAGGPYYNNTHWGPDSAASPQGAVDALQSFWNTINGAMTAGITVHVPAEVDVIDQATGQTVRTETVTPWDLPGEGVGQVLPPATQGLLRLRTGQFVGGREVRGRMFIPGFTETDSDGGRPTSALLTSVNGAAATLAAADLGIYSPTRAVFATITSASMWSEWAVLRSRRD